MMKLEIKLLSPYTRSGRTEEHVLELEARSISLRDLAVHLSREWADRLKHSLIDDDKLVNAEFAVNDRIVSLEHRVEDGDRITVIPYVGGG